MSGSKQFKRSVFFVSDGTAITAETLGHSLLAQFPNVDFDIHIIPYISSEEAATNVVAEINLRAQQDGQKPLVFDTLVDPYVRDIINTANAINLDVFEGLISKLSEELGTPPTTLVGQTHAVTDSESYKARIDAVHFALDNDSLYHSFKNGTLHRNFMGYSSAKTQLMIGLGVSSISDSWYSFAQNVKTLEDYYDALAQNELPIFRGHLLTDEDLIIRKHILNIMCQLHTSWHEYGYYFSEINQVLDRLHEMEEDGLVIITNHSLTVTEKGKAFIRNICMAFDLRMTRKLPETKLFSMTV